MTYVKSSHLAYDLDGVRQAFPICTTLTYLNHASISPIPAPAKAAMDTANEWLTTEPGAFFAPTPPPELGNIFIEFNSEIAALINAHDMREIVGVRSTSAALNAIAQAIDWQPSDNIVFSRVEFPSNAYPWMSLERRGVACRIVPDDGSGGPSVDLFAPHVDGRTRVIAVSAVQFLTGHRADLAALGAFCRDRGILFVVDAIQAAGHIPIDVQAMHIDVLASGGQKSLMGPPGQGFLYVRHDVCETLHPALIGPNATANWMFWSDYDITPEYGAQRFMMGTPNVPGMFGLLASIRFLRTITLPHIDTWTQHLARLAIDDLTAQGYAVITPRDALGPIVTFRIGDPDPDDEASMQAADTLAAALLAHLTARNVRLTKHLDARGVPHLRISTHCYNTEDEVHRVSAILEEYNG